MRFSGSGMGGAQGQPIESTVLQGMNEGTATLQQIHIDLIENQAILREILTELRSQREATNELKAATHAMESATRESNATVKEDTHDRQLDRLERLTTLVGRGSRGGEPPAGSTEPGERS